MSRKVKVTETMFGFEYGAAEVARLADDPKYGVWIGVRTARQSLDIRVTPSGLIRVGGVRVLTAMEGR